MNDWLIGYLCAIAGACMFLFGWMMGSSTIGWECKNIGAFYVGSNVYTCEVKDKK